MASGSRVGEMCREIALGFDWNFRLKVRNSDQILAQEILRKNFSLTFKENLISLIYLKMILKMHWREITPSPLWPSNDLTQIESKSLEHSRWELVELDQLASPVNH